MEKLKINIQSFNGIGKYLSDFYYLLFPHICSACSEALYKGEELLCTQCLYELPKTGFHTKEANPVAELFWGQANIEKATSYYFFHKGSKYRKLIHDLKYKNRPDIGVGLGKHFGAEIKGSDFDGFDVIVPVPLHPKKFRKRGYNQSEKIAEGMAEVLEKPYDTKNFIRTVNTETQTRKNLDERRANVASVFSVLNPEVFENKHILLVDDVVTTGSTLAAAAVTLLELSGTKVSLATLAIADH